jgi:hypothetical protein
MHYSSALQLNHISSQWQCLSGTISGSVACVDAPSNAVELDVNSSDLLPIVDLEQVESFDRQLLTSDCGVAPVPKNIVARHQDLQGLCAIEAWSIENAVNVGLLAGGGGRAQLSFVSGFLCARLHRGATYWKASQNIDGVRVLGEAITNQGLSGCVGSVDIRMGKYLGELGDNICSIPLAQAIVPVIITPASGGGQDRGDQGKRCGEAEELHVDLQMLVGGLEDG